LLAIPAIPFFAVYHRGIYLISALLVAGAVWGLFLSANAQTGTGGFPKNRLVRSALVCAGVTALAMIEFTAAVRPRMDLANSHKARPLAGAILNEVPAGEEIWVMENSYRPFWYYLEPRARYFVRAAELPAEADYFLIPAAKTSDFIHDPKWAGVPPAIVRRFIDNEQKPFDLAKK
jgi:hypothetical protein